MMGTKVHMLAVFVSLQFAVLASTLDDVTFAPSPNSTQDHSWITDITQTPSSSQPDTNASDESRPSILSIAGQENTTSFTNSLRDKEENNGNYDQQLEFSKRVRKALTYVKIIVDCVGLVANSLNVAVFHAQGHSYINCYLMSISICGAIASLVYMISDLYIQILGTAAFSTAFFIQFSYLSVNIYLSPVLHRTLNMLVLFVSIARLLIVLFPLKAKEFVYMRFPRTIIVCTVLVIAAYHSFSPLRYVMVEKTAGNQTYNGFVMSSLFKENEVTLRTLAAVSNALFVYLPLGAGLVVNIVVVVALKRHSLKRREMSSNTESAAIARSERNTTITVVTSSFVFLFLSLPRSSLSILFNDRPDLFGRGKPYEYLSTILGDAVYTLITISLSSDFFTFVSLSTSFRKTFFRLLHIRQTAQTSGQTHQSKRRTEMSSIENTD